MEPAFSHDAVHIQYRHETEDAYSHQGVNGCSVFQHLTKILSGSGSRNTYILIHSNDYCTCDNN